MFSITSITARGRPANIPAQDLTDCDNDLDPVPRRRWRRSPDHSPSPEQGCLDILRRRREDRAQQAVNGALDRLLGRPAVQDLAALRPEADRAVQVSQHHRVEVQSIEQSLPLAGGSAGTCGGGRQQARQGTAQQEHAAERYGRQGVQIGLPGLLLLHAVLVQPPPFLGADFVGQHTRWRPPGVCPARRATDRRQLVGRRAWGGAR